MIKQLLRGIVFAFEYSHRDDDNRSIDEQIKEFDERYK